MDHQSMPVMNNDTPVQIVAIRDRDNPETERYLDTLRIAFEGVNGEGSSPSTYLDDAVDLGIQVLDPAGFGEEDFPLDRLLGAARHTIVVTIDPLPENTRLRERLKELTIRTGDDHQVHVRHPKPTTNGELQGVTDDPLEVEPALRPVVTALRTMECARRLLQTELNRDADGTKLKFFVSHAKVDGIPVALSLLGLMRRIARVKLEDDNRDFDYFYDVEDIPPGSNWRDELERNARNSVLIALRTEEYENRYWCRKEYLWAEEMRVPILVVDLRTRAYHNGSRLPFGPAPKVRIHDGNLFRVILHAVACHLRVLRLEDRVHRNNPAGIFSKVLPRQPSEVSLAAAVTELAMCLGGHAAGSPSARIVYPNPRLSADYLRAVTPLLDIANGPIQLITTDELE